MKKTSLFLLMLAMFGLSIACDSGVRDNEMQREEVGEEIGHEMDDVGDNIEDTSEEIVE